MAGSHPHHQIATVKVEKEEGEDVELNLGLSLGGRFGVDKSHKGPLMRSSSVAGTLPFVREDDSVAQRPVGAPPLARTASLPSGVEEEWMKRKELQALRRTEVKKKRQSEKQPSMKGSGEGRDENKGGGEAGLSVGEKFEGGQQFTRVANSASFPNREVVARSAKPQNDNLMKRKRNFFNTLQGHLAQQGSVDSHGVSSSGASASAQGSIAEAKSPAQTSNDMKCSTYGSDIEDARKQAGTSHNMKKKEAGMNLEDMPYVFTIGDGPNGRKVDGILYRYGKREEVRIMCVCHGGLLSPSEFVKHAGGHDVEHPLRQILVNPSGFSFR